MTSNFYICICVGFNRPQIRSRVRTKTLSYTTIHENEKETLSGTFYLMLDEENGSD
jgi:hypothetical protein